MNYDFSLNKKSVFLILGCCAAIGALLFFAGFVAGWDRGAYYVRLESAGRNAVIAQTAPSSAGREAAEAEKVQGPSSLDLQAPAAPPLEETAFTRSVTVPPSITEVDRENSISKPELPQKDDTADAGIAAEGYSLQVGAFHDESNAASCEQRLKTKGYPAFTFHTFDAGGRPWHTVRIGRYPDFKKAAQAAVVFAGKEKLPVFVRPVNEL